MIAVLLKIIHRSCMQIRDVQCNGASVSTPSTGIASARAGDNARKHKLCKWLRYHWGYKLLPPVGASMQQSPQAVWCLTLLHLDSFFRPLFRPFHANDSRPAAEQTEVVSEYGECTGCMYAHDHCAVSPGPSTGLNTDYVACLALIM